MDDHCVDALLKSDVLTSEQKFELLTKDLTMRDVAALMESYEQAERADQVLSAVEVPMKNVRFVRPDVWPPAHADVHADLFDVIRHVAANWNCLGGFVVSPDNVSLLEANTVEGRRTEIWMLKSDDQASVRYAFTDMTEKITAYSERLSDMKMMAEPDPKSVSCHKVIVWHDAVDGEMYPLPESRRGLVFDRKRGELTMVGSQVREMQRVGRVLRHETARQRPEMFLKLKIDDEVKIRLVGVPFQYWQHWQPVICRSPGPEKDPLMKQSYEPMKRFATWVLDRDDGNRLKIMDFSPSLFDAFSKWNKKMLNNPGGEKGPDWVIKGNGHRDRTARYEAYPLDRTPFTDEERRRINAGITVDGVNMSLKDKLAEARRAHTPEEIEALLAGPPLMSYQQQALDAIAIANSTVKTHGRLAEKAGKTGPSDEFLSQARQRIRAMLEPCQHEWVNAGFTSIRMVCKKCDMEKP